LLNAAFAIAILDLISEVHLPSFFNMLSKHSVIKKYLCLTTWLNLTAWQPTARATRPTLTPSVIRNSKYVIAVIDLKYVCVFCTVIIRSTDNF
jgi:hypothetical protein